MTISRCERFPDDPNQAPAFDIVARRRCLRVFGKKWAWPYAWKGFGCYGWGAGPVGFMLMKVAAA